MPVFKGEVSGSVFFALNEMDYGRTCRRICNMTAEECAELEAWALEAAARLEETASACAIQATAKAAGWNEQRRRAAVHTAKGVEL